MLNVPSQVVNGLIINICYQSHLSWMCSCLPISMYKKGLKAKVHSISISKVAKESDILEELTPLLMPDLNSVRRYRPTGFTNSETATG